MIWKMRTKLVLIMILLTFGVKAGTNPPSLFTPGEVGFDGYDLVSYFGDQLQKGSKTYATDHQGVRLYFASSENLQRFKNYPDRYWPAFDGWCAISLVYDVLKRPDFSHYKIQNNKIHFFEIRAFFNGLTQWEKDPAKHEIIASVHYRHYTEGR